MARQRMLNPSFFTDERVVTVSAFARLLFQGLWCEADREGRLEDKPVSLKMRLFPADNVDCEALLAELAAAGLVLRYQVDGRRLLLIPNFGKHQHVHPKELPSKLPGPVLEAKHDGQAQTLPQAEAPSMAPKPGPKAQERGVDPSESESESVSKSESVKQQAAKKLAARPAGVVDTRWKPLVSGLEQAFKAATGNAYRWQGAKDGLALKRLLAAETPEEILRRWRIGLRGEGWRHTATVAQLGAKWNDLATGPPTGSRAAWQQPGATDWDNQDKSFREGLGT